MVTAAVISAPASATAVPSGWRKPPPGCTTISTPANPTATALQRWTPVGSRNRSAASAVPKTGTVKPITVASASGSSE